MLSDDTENVHHLAELLLDRGVIEQLVDCIHFTIENARVYTKDDDISNILEDIDENALYENALDTLVTGISGDTIIGGIPLKVPRTPITMHVNIPINDSSTSEYKRNIIRYKMLLVDATVVAIALLQSLHQQTQVAIIIEKEEFNQAIENVCHILSTLVIDSSQKKLITSQSISVNIKNQPGVDTIGRAITTKYSIGDTVTRVTYEIQLNMVQLVGETSI